MSNEMITPQEIVEEEPRFSIIEETDIGTLEEIKEEIPLLPPTKGVKLITKMIMPNANKEGTYRWIRVGLQLVDGIEGKWKNSYVWTENMCYYADPTKYKVNENKNAFYGRLASLKRATQVELNGKINDEIIQAMTNKLVLGDIVQVKDDYRGGLINRAINLKMLPIEAQV